MTGGPASDPQVDTREANGPAAPALPRLETLRRRPSFLRVARRGRKAVMPGLVLQAAPQPSAKTAEGAVIGVGFTVSRKVGKAVARNRAKRRLREIARQVMPIQARPGMDYVLIGRRETVARPFHLLRRDLERALARVARTAAS